MSKRIDNAPKHLYLQNFTRIARVDLPRKYQGDEPTTETVTLDYCTKSAVNCERQRYVLVIRSNRYGQLTESISVFLSLQDLMYYMRERLREYCTSFCGVRITPPSPFWYEILMSQPIVKFHVFNPNMSYASVPVEH